MNFVSLLEKAKPFNRNVQNEYSLFVLNIPYSVNRFQLKELFSKAGRVSFAHIILNEGKSTGKGVVKYKTETESLNAIKLFHLTNIYGYSRKLSVTKYDIEKEKYFFDS